MTKVESIRGTFISLADGTSFTLPLDDISNYGIVVNDQVIVSGGRGGEVVIIFQTNQHKADITLKNGIHGLEGRITSGTRRSRYIDPACPFSDYRTSYI